MLVETRRDIATLIKGETRPTEQTFGTKPRLRLLPRLERETPSTRSMEGYGRVNKDLRALSFFLAERPVSPLDCQARG